MDQEKSLCKRCTEEADKKANGDFVTRQGVPEGNSQPSVGPAAAPHDGAGEVAAGPASHEGAGEVAAAALTAQVATLRETVEAQQRTIEELQGQVAWLWGQVQWWSRPASHGQSAGAEQADRWQRHQSHAPPPDGANTW